MANVCRLCGNNEGEVIFIFGNEALKHHIDLKIRAGLDIQIFPDDPLPKHACIWCLGKLDEFWTFLHQCRRVQTKLRRLLPERIPFQFANINSDQRQNPKTSTEESSAHVEVLETLGDSTGNDCNNLGNLNSIFNGKSEVCTVKVEPHSIENSNDSFHSYNESCGNKCEPCVNDPHLIDTDLLVSTQNGTSLVAGELDSCCQGSKENMAISGAGYTSESVAEDNSSSVEGKREVQDNLSSEKTDLTNTFHERSETTLSVNNNNDNYNSLSDRPQDFHLMEEQILEVRNNVLSTTSILSVAEQGQEDKRSNDKVLVNNDLNQNQFNVPNMIPQSNRYLTTATKGHSEKQSRDTCCLLDNNYEFSLLIEEQPSKSEKLCTDCTQFISTVVVNNASNNEKEIECYSAFNTLRPSLLKGEVACKTTSPATNTCSQDVTVHEVHHAEVTQGDGVDSSNSLIFTDQPLNHPIHVISGITNVSSGIEAGKLMRKIEFDLGGLSITGDSQPLQVIHSGADMADMSDQDMEISGIVSDLIEIVAVTIENDVRRNLQLNTSSRTNSNPSHENKEHSIIVNSGSSATCVHGIDASMCMYKQCCDSHPFDKYWKKVGSRFCCLLCEYVSPGGGIKIRDHISAHVSLNIFECLVCNKKLRSYKNLIVHMNIHSRKNVKSSTKVFGVYSCENCSKSFKSKDGLRDHQIKRCGIDSVSCPGCGLRFSSLKRHSFNCPGKTGFVCDICKKSYKAKGVLIKHLRTHDQGEYACNKCEKNYSKLYLLRNHQNAVHGTGKFQCTHCTKTFHNTFNLEQHVARHTRIRNYLCEICSKSFLYSSNLATHMKFHGKRDMKCHLCGKMYFRKNMLLSHMKNIHCK